jgi:hypothetical protein
MHERRIIQPKVSRRGLLVGASAIAAYASLPSLGCDEIDTDLLFALGAAVLAPTGITSVSLLGMSVGSLLYSAYKTVQTKTKPDKIGITYTSVPTTYDANSKQGQGSIYNFSDAPASVQGEIDAVSSLAADGKNYVMTVNPTPDTIVKVQLETNTGVID